ncbi:uncharacterized protein LOC131466129 [Solea solea]|uniref:uncharacterized protein LOC131466129 n=1 Tax=Solea solea TaxID=90069 RepID=UPI00272D6334|nr:uncharacterized protein LOC131466129 [Solea solea]
MKLGERKATLRAIRDNIEMELFSSEELCVVIPVQEEVEEHMFYQRHLEHPLFPDPEKESESESESEVQTRTRTRPSPELPAGEVTKHYTPIPGFMEEIEIEMEVFPPFKVSKSERVKASQPDTMSLLKWRRATPQRRGLVVRDVVCLPAAHDLAQPQRQIVPHDDEGASPGTAAITARITIDDGWSISQMESRLAMLFRGKFVRRPGQRFSFTYLQCLQGSRVLFVPDPPAEGWTTEQVLSISQHGPLYVFAHLEVPQAECERPSSVTPALNREEFCLQSNTDEDNQPGEETQPDCGRTTEELTLDLDTVLRLFRQENVDGDVETHVQVRRTELLHSALEWLRNPAFCFRATPIISFSGEETNGHEGPLREFFRLTLLELQQSSVFEGHPGRLFLTYDLAALEGGKYAEAGILISWSLAQGGPGPSCLHPVLFQLMCGHNPSLEDFTWRDITDTKVQSRLQQLQSYTDVKLLSPAMCEWVSSCGIPGIYSDYSDEISDLYIRLVKHYIFHRVASMISQFKAGMNSCGGLWDIVMLNWRVFVPAMTSAHQTPLSLFGVCYSRQGCELRAAEETTVNHWETVLDIISNGQADFSVKDVLTFITGADHLPPHGFPRVISLRFYTGDGLPYASTCALELFLPRSVVRAVDLLALLSRAVHKALGFSRVQRGGD